MAHGEEEQRDKDRLEEKTRDLEARCNDQEAKIRLLFSQLQTAKGDLAAAFDEGAESGGGGGGGGAAGGRPRAQLDDSEEGGDVVGPLFADRRRPIATDAAPKHAQRRRRSTMLGELFGAEMAEVGGGAAGAASPWSPKAAGSGEGLGAFPESNASDSGGDRSSISSPSTGGSRRESGNKGGGGKLSAKEVGEIRARDIEQKVNAGDTRQALFDARKMKGVGAQSQKQFKDMLDNELEGRFDQIFELVLQMRHVLAAAQHISSSLNLSDATATIVREVQDTLDAELVTVYVGHVLVLLEYFSTLLFLQLRWGGGCTLVTAHVGGDHTYAILRSQWFVWQGTSSNFHLRH